MSMISEKLCRRCGSVKPLDEFHRRTQSKDGHQFRCKKCAVEMAVAHQRANPEKHRAKARAYNNTPVGKRRQRDHHVRKNFGITLDQYEALREGVTACRTCGAVERLELDHCHTTGRLRGWLCHKCNKILGLARDNPATLIALAEYLTTGASL